MTEIIIKKEIDENKMKALLAFLKSWGLDVELKTTIIKTTKKSHEFSLANGLWENYQINSTELRKQAWQRN
jgi:N6-adenosine-specific RNA methylase IME4